MGSRRRGRRRRRIQLALLVLGAVLGFVLTFARRVSAAPSSFALAWPSSPQPACIEQGALEEAVAARLGRNPFVAVERADVILHGGELPPTAGRLRARVERRDRQGVLLGSRDLEAATCADLRRSAAFVLVLIVDPDALLGAPSPPPSPPASAVDVPHEREPTNVSPRRSARAVVTPAPRRPHPTLADVGLGAAVSSGLLPGGDAGPLVLIGVRPLRAPLRFEWRGSYRVALGEPRGRSFSALEQEWRACFVVETRGPLGVTACGGAAWLAIFPQTDGLADGDQAPKAMFAPMLALGPTLKLGRIRVFADLSLLLPRPRYAFSYLDDEQRRTKLHEVDHAVISAAIGVTRSF